ncbi:hypothetical protein N7468_004017 [Penicillium chermesinum]|uniref:Myb-like DNA-binding domain-containing protein n=1 Tax=Penicillium chermesinum TaxID=63820 RepID=A0A9W9PA40_9EURO|nr:uncharacterized protein N7468_004017 [Penicillium chermesinum]KAJ5239398.1 hypothetical protein N7468_004017 [Penicillium chermesinum]KAJ6141343.1 hypothetical protein N7470_010239 [Penicillium chermesinum]
MALDALTSDHPHPTDKDFVFECLKAFNSSKGKIDIDVVAAALGYTNAKSAANRWNSLKRTHGFKLDATSGRPSIEPPQPARGRKRGPKPPSDDDKPDETDHDASPDIA